MQRRILSLLCAVAIVLGMITVPAFATTAEGSLQDQVNKYTSGVITLTENAQDLKVNANTYIDLNGYTVAGLSVATGATVYVSDSQTDDYTVADGNYGAITGIAGAVEAMDGYVAVREGGALSFHRVDLAIKSMSLRASVAGVYYTSSFAADEVVSAQVESYGVALSVVEAPTAENLDVSCGYSVLTDFASGEKSGTLLTGIMDAKNDAETNAAHAAMDIYGRAYIKTADGYTFGAVAVRDLQEQVEAIDTILGNLSATQKAGITAFYNTYKAAMESWNIPNLRSQQLGDIVITIPVESENGVVTETVTVESNGMSITVPFGTLVEKAELTLNVTKKETSDSGIEAADGETLMPFDVHVDGVSSENTVPLTVALGKVMPENLNMGNYSIYHVEASGTKEMTLVATDEAFTAHNQYKYTLDGELTLHMATFSEVAALTEEPKWEGKRDYSWYTNAAAPADENGTVVYEIRTADQLAAFSAIVGGMAEGIAQDSFSGKTVKLLADIDLDDVEGDSKIFYPIGYNSSDGKYEKTGVAITSSLQLFCGTFDGNGNTIKNFYQNTWEMKGDNNYYDATLQYYRDGMGLFGRVYGATIKNLTVENFQNDGEYTTTGVIAAYADGATFENIAVFMSNPRVYNIGNGGIVGCVGWYAKEAGLETTFKNITVDNSNKISALWGSYDVACGGVVGQYYPTSGQSSKDYPVNGGVHFENCHVSAQMDVYNDVCANYQYYAYRYAGMLIGSVRENVTIDGREYPKMDGISAENCTVHFGTWNDYYYCEFEKNGHPSYSGPDDYKFSRVPHSELNFTDSNGNGIIDTAEEKASVTGCKHEHTAAEDNQAIYLPFNNLVTGYGWGVTTKAVGDLEGVTILKRDVADSVDKFEIIANGSYETETTVAIGDLFKAKEQSEVAIVPENVQVTVSPADDTSTVSGTYKAAEADENGNVDWTQGTLTFSGTGAAKITITDYYFCKPTTITVTINDRQPVEKFDIVMNNGDFLHRVGNNGTVALDKLFEAKDGVVGTVSVSVEPVNDTGASGTYANNAIQFNGTGVVKVTIKDNDEYCKPTELYLEVVDAVNATGATSATSNNVVLLNDCGLSSMTVSGRYTFYGNGFTMTYTGNGQYLNNGLKQGVVMVSGNGSLDNVRIKASIYPSAYMYYGYTILGDYVQGGPSSVEGDKTRYHYQLSAVAASGNATISNCYIYGGRTNIFVNTGDVTIKNSVLECGVVANIQIQSVSDNTVTLENLTTIQHKVNPTLGDTSKVMLGSGVVVGPETETNPTIVLNGYLKQYNWVTSEDADTVSDSMAEKLINGALDATAFNHTINGKVSSNLGIIYMNTYNAPIENNTGLPYAMEEISLSSAKGLAYSLQGATAEQINSDYVNADRTTVNSLYVPQFVYSADLGGQKIDKTETGDEFCYCEDDTIKLMFPSGDTKELDLAALVNIQKYADQDLNLVITCKDSTGKAVTVNNNKVALSVAGTYTVTYTVTDTMFFDKAGNAVNDSVSYSWDVSVDVSLKDTKLPDAYFLMDSSKQKMGYSGSGSNVRQFIPFLAGLKIYDYNGQTEYLRFDGDSDYNKVAKITLTSSSEANHYLITVTLTDGGIITLHLLSRADSGGSTYSGSIKTSNNTIYYLADAKTKATDTTWTVDYYKFTGNNGVEINSGNVVFGCEKGSQPSGSFNTTIKYTVTYDANGGKCVQAVGYATSAATTMTLPNPTRSGYLFAGWYTAASGGTRVGGAGDSYTPSSNITLYAQWGKPCTVTYDANGGNCDTASAYYNGTALTLPTSTRDGYWFIGWYDAASGGNKIGDAGTTYNPAGEIILYAHWQEAIEYTVTYNANGGSCNPASATYQGTALILPTPSKEGHTFKGWYTAASGGTKIGDAGAGYIPSANITLYAQWTVNSYTITYSKSNTERVTGPERANYGETVTVTVVYSKGQEKAPTVTGGVPVTSSGSGTNYTYTFVMPANEVTMTITGESCVAAGTLITLADGTQVAVEELTGDELLLVWNLETGRYEAAPIVFVDSDAETEYEVIRLVFADGTEVEVIYEHGFFDVTTGEYVYIDAMNATDYIGHSFVKQGELESNTWETVELVDVVIETKLTTAYSPVTFSQLCYYVDGMLSMPGGIEGLFNIFEVDVETMSYDAEKMAADIETYGLFTYEDFGGMIPEEAFYAFNGAWLKVAMGKGMLTWEDIEYMANRYVPLM